MEIVIGIMAVFIVSIVLWGMRIDKGYDDLEKRIKRAVMDSDVALAALRAEARQYNKQTDISIKMIRLTCRQCDAGSIVGSPEPSKAETVPNTYHVHLQTQDKEVWHHILYGLEGSVWTREQRKKKRKHKCKYKCDTCSYNCKNRA